MSRPTVVFGPFVGEFGWELLFWQGWVRRASRERYADHHRVVATRAGRGVLYPDAHEVRPLPQWFLDLRTSGHGYHTDGWVDGVPAPRAAWAERWRGRVARRGPKGTRQAVVGLIDAVGTRPLPGPDVRDAAAQVLRELTADLPDDAELVVPWRDNRIDGVRFGLEVHPGRGRRPMLITHQLPYSAQLLEPLHPTAAGAELVAARLPADRPVVSVFPRRRDLRRPDKNWPRERYVELVAALQALPEHPVVAVLGEPGGAHFAGEAPPPGVVDLVNIDDDVRLDAHLAVLRRSAVACGSISGAVTLASACDRAVVTWGEAHFEASYRDADFLDAPLDYLTSPQPSVADVVQAVARHLPAD